MTKIKIKRVIEDCLDSPYDIEHIKGLRAESVTYLTNGAWEVICNNVCGYAFIFGSNGEVKTEDHKTEVQKLEKVYGEDSHSIGFSVNRSKNIKGIFCVSERLANKVDSIAEDGVYQLLEMIVELGGHAMLPPWPDALRYWKVINLTPLRHSRVATEILQETAPYNITAKRKY